MAAKRRKKKNDDIKKNVQITLLIIFSVLLGFLIFSESGLLGQGISTILGGLMSWVKYVLPIGIFILGVYLIFNKSEGLKGKAILYLALLLSIMVIFSVNQFSGGTFGIDRELNDVLDAAYELGIKNIGGGLLGTLIAYGLINLVGEVGTYIISIGIAVIVAVFIFGFRPAVIIEQFMENREEKKNLRNKAREEEAEDEIEEKVSAKKKKQPEILDDQIEINIHESKNNNDNVDYIENNIFKKHKKDKKNKDSKSQNNVELQKENQDELFTEQTEEKIDKTKQVLTLDHTMVVEDVEYEFPPIELLQAPAGKKALAKKTLTDTASKLQKTLYSFGVSAKVENVSVGPAITRYELKPAEGVRVSKIANLADDIALNLAAESIRIEAPIPGKQAVGIEIPNKEKEVVLLREIIDTPEFRDAEAKTSFALGKDAAGDVVVTDIAKMPHVLIAGSTGSGKSVCINTLITSIIYKAKPSEVKLVMVDPKVVELSIYNGIPHLLIPVVTDAKKAAGALMWAVQEMVHRYSLFAEKGVRDIKGYNKILENDGEKLPHIVIIIDELADLMMVAAKDVEDAICRLAQMARAAGMHLVIATQRPSVDVITGLIKANVPSRIAFAVSSGVDSRTILDMYGAEKLLGKGDMLFSPVGSSKPQRIQGAFISDEEVEKIVDFLKAGGEAKYNSDIIESIEKNNSTDKELDESTDDDADEFLNDAIEMVIETGQASTSFIQRRFKVGYARAGRIMDQMEARGIVSAPEGSKPRKVLMTKERWQELNMAPSEDE